MEDLLFEDNIAYLPALGAAVIMAAETKTNARVGKQRQSNGKPAVAADSPAPFTLSSIDDIAPWGDNNLFPQEIIELAERSTELPSLLNWKAKAALGAETLPYNREYNEATKEWEDVPITDPDIVSFFLSQKTKLYLRESFTDLYWFANVFPDLIKNEAGDKIAYLGTHDASWCRWYKMNNQGWVDKCAVSSYWPGGGIYGDPKYFRVHDVVNPYDWNVVDKLKGNEQIKRFVYPVSLPSPGHAYYQVAPWDGLRTSGWLKVAAQIPVFKLAIMRNQVHIKYLIKIPNTYWPAAFPLWNTYTQEQKVAKKKEKLAEINKTLSNVENAGKSILNEVGFDKDGQKLPGWDIEEIGDKLKDGAYIEDSQEASAHTLRALGLDGSLVGSGPGRDLNAGGGSDKLIAFNMYCALLGSERDAVHAPIYFIAEYNGWLERYPFFKVKTTDASPQALDTSRKVSQADTSKQVSQTVQDQWPQKQAA
jgi:hypothetical protein